MYVYVSSIIWRKKSLSMKCHIACMLHVVCILSILTRTQWHWRDSVVGGPAAAAAAPAGRRLPPVLHQHVGHDLAH